jgi:hypothetical protein
MVGCSVPQSWCQMFKSAFQAKACIAGSVPRPPQSLVIDFFIRPDASPRAAARKALRMRAEGCVHKRMQARVAARTGPAHMHRQIDAIIANCCTYTTQLQQ